MHKLYIIILLATLLTRVSPTYADELYTVRPGDTLSSIARDFGTTVTALVQANEILNPNLIFVGQQLVIPGANEPPPPEVPLPPESPPGPPVATTTYVVQPGDTLFRIATRFGVSLQAIVTLNGIPNANVIYVGQQLLIPGAAAPPPANPPPAPPPQSPPPPPAGANLLANGSFEGGWYNLNGIPELQIPDAWQFEWDVGPNPFDPNAWSDWVRPETRVLPSVFLPPSERGLFIWDGDQTVKIFKGSGSISFRLTTDVYLQPGTYLLEINLFPDLVDSYGPNGKIWAPDPLSGEVRFIVGAGGSDWVLPVFGQRNTLTHTFTITTPQTVRIGAAIRGRFPLLNNGWFLDAWSLRRI